MGLNFKDLSKINDSASSATITDEKMQKIADAKKRHQFLKLRKRIKDELSDTETTEGAVEAVRNVMADAEPNDIVQAVVEVLAETIEGLEEKNGALETELADAKKQKPGMEYAELRQKIKDALDGTESTEDAVTSVSEFLETVPAEDVLKATVEVLAETIDQLQKAPEPDPAPAE